MIDFLKNLEKLERKAQENQNLAQYEIEIAKNSKLEAKIELKRVKIRKKLYKMEMEIAETRENLAEKKKSFAKKKLEIKNKNILKISEEEIKNESEYANFYEKLALNSREIAQIHLDTARLEESIAKLKLVLNDSRITLANERKKLSKLQIRYIKLVRGKSSENKIINAEKKYKNQQEEVWKIKDKGIKKEREIKSMENELSDLQRQLSQKLLEREKIRP